MRAWTETVFIKLFYRSKRYFLSTVKLCYSLSHNMSVSNFPSNILKLKISFTLLCVDTFCAIQFITWHKNMQITLTELDMNSTVKKTHSNNVKMYQNVFHYPFNPQLTLKSFYLKFYVTKNIEKYLLPMQQLKIWFNMRHFFNYAY